MLFSTAPGYTPAGDIMVMALIGTFAILIRFAYIKPSKEFQIYKLILLVLGIAAAVDVFYHVLLVSSVAYPIAVIYLLRFLYHALLFTELPFDIIKFDRSLVIGSKNSPKAETLVAYLAHMFTDMNYSVLYEGIEDEQDEEHCANMFARYLQGYKYSKPIPIEGLFDFLVKEQVVE